MNLYCVEARRRIIYGKTQIFLQWKTYRGLKLWRTHYTGLGHDYPWRWVQGSHKRSLAMAVIPYKVMIPSGPALLFVASSVSHSRKSWKDFTSDPCRRRVICGYDVSSVERLAYTSVGAVWRTWEVVRGERIDNRRRAKAFLYDGGRQVVIRIYGSQFLKIQRFVDIASIGSHRRIKMRIEAWKMNMLFMIPVNQASMAFDDPGPVAMPIDRRE